MKKLNRLLVVVFAFAVCFASVACKKTELQQKNTASIETPEVESTLLFELPDRARFNFTNYEYVQDSDGKTIIVFFVEFTNKGTASCCFNDYVNEQNGVLRFYQNGQKLAPRFTDLTENITVKIQAGQMVKAAKGFELIDSQAAVDIVLQDESGAELQRHSLPLK